MNFNRPPQILTIVREGAIDKISKSLNKFIILAILGGAYISIGSMFAVTVAGGLNSLSVLNPGIVKLVFGLTFPLGFLLVTLAGAELFTSTTAIMGVGLFSKTLNIKTLLKIWGLSYFFNLIGSLIVVFLTYKSGLFSSESYKEYIFHIADKKLENPFFTAFVKGIFANWLVCLAAFVAYASKDVTGKIFAMWLPVTAFVAMGMEHSIANMFFIPMASVLGHDVSIFEFIIRNLIPVTLGNITGGVIFVALPYSIIYLDK
ncbi:MAG: formate/nitrite transporter family protein [Spirochaetales bacterium]|nr:formate/nitrite transporter family protein [Spirochaetales bacterium]